MEQELVRTGLNGSALVGMLAQLALIDPPSAAPSFVEGMGRWLGWKEAIPLSSVLQQAAPGAAAAVSAARALNQAGNANADAWGRELGRAQAALTLAIEHNSHTAREDGHDFLPFRRWCVGVQQNMDSTLSPLREQLRTAVAKRSPALARLAALDAVLAQALAPREQALLALLPVLLEKHFLRLRPVQPPGTAASGHAAPNPPWLDRFRHDMRQLLLAELDLRLQPSLGLLATLRSA
jgi:hypothetical protein